MAVLLQDAGSGTPITVKPAPPPPAAKPAAVVPYNPAGYVPGGSSVAVGKAIETQAITHPGPAPVAVPATILQELPGVKPAPFPPPLVLPLPPPPGSEQPKPAPDPPKPSAPAPTTPTPNTSGVYAHLELEQLWALANGQPLYEDVAAAIAEAESSGEPWRINNTAYKDKPGYSPPKKGNLPEYSVGLWQINIYSHTQYTEAEMRTPLGNAQAAVALSKDGLNFDPWSTYKDKSYLKYLTGAASPTPKPTVLPAATPRSSKAPAGVQTAWGDIIGVYSTGVPKQHDQVRLLADSLLTIVKG